MSRIWRNRNFILLLGLCLGIGAGHLAPLSRKLVLPALALVMTLSTMGVSSEAFRQPRALLAPVASALLMNFMVLGGVLMGLGHILIREEDFLAGFAIMASVPPAVAVIPFTQMLGGGLHFSLTATIGAYLAALVIAPLMTMALLGSASMDPMKLMSILFQLILIPLILSRILRGTGLSNRIEPVRGAITNWSFFIIIYTIVGLNRELFLERPLWIAPVAIVSFSSTFLLGTLIWLVTKAIGIKEDIATSLVLLGTMKNSGLAGGLALALFGEHTALPAAVSTVFMITYMIWLGIVMSRRKVG